MDLEKLERIYYHGQVYPPRHQLYRAIELCPLDRTKVVILGQDPYHGPGQANGLAFSVNKGIAIPPSLSNIFDELCMDLDVPLPDHGDLTCWANQGVLLLNSILTVDQGKPMSHARLGWEDFTDRLIRGLNDSKKPVAFILWGKKARDKAALINNPIHCIIESVHPSPLSAHKGFFGSRPFSQANDFLIRNDIKPINWRVE